MTEFKPYVCMQTNSKCYKNTITAKPVGILWHSTGANNTNLKRYVQPSDYSESYAEDVKKIGKNLLGNDWNHTQVDAGVNAWIGKFADGTVGTVQTMPWNYAPWGSGSGAKGSLNHTKVNGNQVSWIQFEICEDGLNNKDYAQKVYDEAIRLTVYLCKMYNIDPSDTVTINGVKVPTITCHNDAAKLKLATNHADINHWFPKILNKDMDNVRSEVKALLNAAETSYSEEWVNGKWYEKDGSQIYEPIGEWKRNNTGWWYEDTSGWYPISKWVKIDSKWYYFDEFGYMESDTWIDGWYVGEDGAYVPDKKKTTTTNNSYKVRVSTDALNVRASASTNAKINKVIYRNTICTVSKTSNGWGYIGSGWIMLMFTKKI